MKSIELFPVTVFKGQVSNNEILKNLLVSEILNESKDLEIPEDWTTHKVKTSFSTGSNILNHTELTSQYVDCMRDVFDKDFDVSINKIWYNVYTDGEYQ